VPISAVDKAALLWFARRRVLSIGWRPCYAGACVAPKVEVACPSGAFVAALDDDGRAALGNAYRRRLGVADRPFELTARAWAVIGIARSRRV
jgi:hypothetical protein